MMFVKRRNCMMSCLQGLESAEDAGTGTLKLMLWTYITLKLLLWTYMMTEFRTSEFRCSNWSICSVGWHPIFWLPEHAEIMSLFVQQRSTWNVLACDSAILGSASVLPVRAVMRGGPDSMLILSWRYAFLLCLCSLFGTPQGRFLSYIHCDVVPGV